MFKVNWPRFSDEFISQASQQLTLALNKGQKPNNIAGDIEVADLNMGTKPPDLEILEIGELGEDRFKGIFKMTYAGDAHVILNTKVQANPLNLPRHEYTITKRSPILAANHPLVVPMRLRISNLKLRGIVVLVIDKTKGTTLVFKNDPLEKVDVNSTFDGVASVRRFLQQQIEGQLRQMFQEDLPMLIHKLSLVLIQQQEEAGQSSNTMQSSGSNSSDSISSVESSDDQAKNLSMHVSHHFMSEETVHRFISRPHHQKWSGNEPVTTLDSESDVKELESQAIGAIVLQKSLMPNFGPLGLEIINDSTITTPSPSSSSSMEANRLLSRSPMNSRQSLEQTSPIGLIDPFGPINRPLANTLRKPIQINPSVHNFLAPNNSADSGRRIQNQVEQKRFQPNTTESGALRPNKFPNQYSSKFRGRSSSSITSSSPSIIHRSSVSLYNEPTSAVRNDFQALTQSAHSEQNANGLKITTGGSSRQRYAPTPYQFNQNSVPNHGYNYGSIRSGPSSDAGGSIKNSNNNKIGKIEGNSISIEQSGGSGGIGNISGANGEGGGNSNATTEPLLILKDRVVLKQGDNQVTAHLASLMLAHHTISPVMHRVEHATFRASTGFSTSGTASLSSSANLAAMTASPSVIWSNAGGSSEGVCSGVGLGLVGHTAPISPTIQQNGTIKLNSPPTPVSSSASYVTIGATRNRDRDPAMSPTVSTPAPSAPYVSSTRKRGSTRNVRKLNLPSGIAVPAIPRNGSNTGLVLGFDVGGGTVGGGGSIARGAGSISGRSFGSSVSSTHTSTTATRHGGGVNNIDDSDLASAEVVTLLVMEEPTDIATMQKQRSSNLTLTRSSVTQQERIDEGSESDDLAGILADRLEMQKNRGSKIGIRKPLYHSRSMNSTSNSGMVANAINLNTATAVTPESSSDDDFHEALTISTQSVPIGMGFLSRSSSNAGGGALYNHEEPVSPNVHHSPPPRSASSMSTSSAITVKKVIRVKSHASTMTVTPGSLNNIATSTS
ncbi:ERMES complex subunit [Physocladia obscura]|uniref:Mitochondrial distribution and morphology protein 34 n=1 Tax=Physocladia obscura TaxID=109957 RepID=A0AAD5T9R9_9FUNG|nr:ERMES complex subunit [Physocladia obscura]